MPDCLQKFKKNEIGCDYWECRLNIYIIGNDLINVIHLTVEVNIIFY